MGKFSKPVFPFDSGMKFKTERRGERNMRNYFTWIGLILCVSVLFAVEAGATVPFADDLPDVRLIRQGVGTPESMDPAFDLDDYVIDNDTSDDALTWTYSVEGGGPIVNVDTASLQLGLHEVEVQALSSAGLYDATFEADDLSDTDDTVSTLKYSEFWLTEPKFTADNRLSFKGAGMPRFTFVKLFDGSGAPETTEALSGYISPSASVLFGPLTMYDLTSGAPVRVDQGQAVSFGGLDASVLTSSGRIVLTPSGALSCAVLVSVPAVLDTPGNTFDRAGNWDGKVIMVAPAAKTQTFQGQVSVYGAGTLAQYCRFEDIPGSVPAEMQPDGAGSNASPTFITGGWRMNGIGSTPLPTASLLTSTGLGSTVAGASAKQFAGATSGNALKLAFTSDAAGMACSISTLRLSPLVPGTIYGFSMNVATSIPASEAAEFYARKVKFVAQAYTRADEGYFAGTFVGNAIAAGQQTVGLPVDGEWRQIYMEMRMPELSFALDNSHIGGTGTTNVSYDGLLNFFRVFVDPDTPDFDVFIDNVYIYNKGMSDLNYADVNEAVTDPDLTGLVEKGLADGVTAFTAYNAQNVSVNGIYTGNDFELGTDLGSNNWRITGMPGLVNVGTPSGAFAVASPGRLQSDGCLQASVTNGTSTVSGEQDGGRAASRPVAIRGKDTTGADILDDAGDPVPNLAGEGYYGISFWLGSNGASCVNNPQIKVYLVEQKPAVNQIQSFTLLGPSNVPASPDGWYQYGFVGAYPKLTDGGQPMQQANIIVDVATKQGWQGAGKGAGDYSGATSTSPGFLGDADVYVDDIVVHRVRDTQEYWNASLFE